METETLAQRLSDLAREAESLAESIRTEDDLPERRARDAHRLREVLGVALILSDRLARAHDRDRMLVLDDRGDGTGHVRFSVALDESQIVDINPK
jgi:hypothetical protein